MIAPTPPAWWDGFITGVLAAVAWGALIAAALYRRRQLRILREGELRIIEAENRLRAEKRERES